MVGRFFDALERDFLEAFPENEQMFREGLEKEIELLFSLEFSV